jgi:4,5-DOPA dioxygenase extradiol
LNVTMPGPGFNHAMSTTLPPLFISHGSPMIALEPGAAGAFLQRLGPAIDATFGRPKAILALSAHTLAREPAGPPQGRALEREARKPPATPVALAAARHEAVYDFGNFDPRLFTLRYDAPGAPELAERVTALTKAHRLPQGGLDHGIWTALMYLYPGADVPVLPLAWSASESPAALFALGQSLTALADEGVLIVGTGSITHNLRRVFEHGLHDGGQPEIAESRTFRTWMHDKSAALDWDSLFNYRRLAPHAADMHPSDEHLLPWFIAAGAGGREAAPLRLHESVTHGVLGMDTYAFGPQAAMLAA